MTSSLPSANDAPKRILIFATTHWVSTARLAMSLAAFACRVDLLAPPNHPALATDAVAAHHRYWPLMPMRGLRRALRVSGPDLLLVADELSFLLVEELSHWASTTGGAEAAGVLALLQRSFGSIDCLPLTRSRMALLSAAAAAGTPIPPTMALRDKANLDQLAREMPGPWMFKADATWGGFGVRKVCDASHLSPTWKHLQQPLNLLQSLKRGWRGKEWGHLHVWLGGSKREVIAQKFIAGTERTGMAVCARGRLIAVACLAVEQVRYENGPASILRAVEDPAMLESIRRIAAATGISGFCGFDFMVSAETGEPLLLEMNMRPTQLAHLSLGAGRDLCAALLRALLQCEEAADRPNAAESGLVALFPQEILRDPQGLQLAQTFHDVPWAAPHLMRFAVAPATLPTLLTTDPRWCGKNEIHANGQTIPA